MKVSFQVFLDTKYVLILMNGLLTVFDLDTGRKRLREFTQRLKTKGRKRWRNKVLQGDYFIGKSINDHSNQSGIVSDPELVHNPGETINGASDSVP